MNVLWKTWVHQRLVTPLGQPGAMTLFQASPTDHLALAKHLTAEVKTEEFVAGKGVVVKWERLRRQNHWFDALYNACAAGSFCGLRLVDSVLVLAASVALNGQQPKSTPAQIRREYSVYPFGDYQQQREQFNSIGQQGWEYVGHQPSLNQANGFAIFKRPLANQ